jgi:catechol 2,3-dioxygenase-like lactoylglutathione lyase family enzyme
MRFQFVFEAKDFETAVRFYGDGLGLPVEHAWDRGADKGSIFRAADGFIEVVSDSMGLRGPHGIGVAIQTEDVDLEFQRVLRSSLAVEREPEDRPWGTREFFLLDPDAYAVTFFQERERSEPSGPDERARRRGAKDG